MDIQADRKLINDLGGPAKVAEILSLPKVGGQQRVHNWMSRGIPAAVKVARPDLFMPGFVPQATANAASEEVVRGLAAESAQSLPLTPWTGTERRSVTSQATEPAHARRQVDKPDGFPAIEPSLGG